MIHKFRDNKRKIALYNMQNNTLIGETSYFQMQHKDPYHVIELANQELVNLMLYNDPYSTYDKVYIKELYNLAHGRRLAYFTNNKSEDNSSCLTENGWVFDIEFSETDRTSVYVKDTVSKYAKEEKIEDIEMRIIARDGFLLVDKFISKAAYNSISQFIYMGLCEAKAFDTIDELVESFGGEEALLKLNKSFAEKMEYLTIVRRENGIIIKPENIELNELFLNQYSNELF